MNNIDYMTKTPGSFQGSFFSLSVKGDLLFLSDLFDGLSNRFLLLGPLLSFFHTGIHPHIDRVLNRWRYLEFRPYDLLTSTYRRFM